MALLRCQQPKHYMFELFGLGDVDIASSSIAFPKATGLELHVSNVNT